MSGTSGRFEQASRGREQEEGTAFRPKFDADGLISAIAVDANGGDVLMLAHMNAEALEKTILTGIAHYWSRSRQEIWLKGGTSGNTQKIREIRTDCDQDTVLLIVEQDGAGAACHTGRKSCFYRTIIDSKAGIALEETDAERKFDPEETYGKK